MSSAKQIGYITFFDDIGGIFVIYDAKIVVIYDRYPLMVGALEEIITDVNNKVRVMGRTGAMEDLFLTVEKEKPDITFIDSHIFLSLGITFDEMSCMLSSLDRYATWVFMASMLSLEKEAMKSVFMKNKNVFIIGRNVSKSAFMKFLRSPTSSHSLDMNETFKPLTKTEREILLLMSSGASLTAIANSKKRSLKTISAHKKNIKDKLCMKNDIELLRFVSINTDIILLQ